MRVVKLRAIFARSAPEYLSSVFYIADSYSREAYSSTLKMEAANSPETKYLFSVIPRFTSKNKKPS
jgi:hypothetical protein